MSVRVIKHGEDLNPVYRAWCMNCGCIIEFLEGDARQEFDRNEMLLVVACPDCKREIWTDARLAKRKVTR